MFSPWCSFFPCVANEHLCAWCKQASDTWLLAVLRRGCCGLSLPFTGDGLKIVLFLPSVGKLYALKRCSVLVAVHHLAWFR